MKNIEKADKFAKIFVLGISGIWYKLKESGYSVTPQEVIGLVLDMEMNISYEQIEKEYIERLKENRC